MSMTERYHPLDLENLRLLLKYPRKVDEFYHPWRAASVCCTECEEVAPFRTKCIRTLIEAIARSNATHPHLRCLFSNFCKCQSPLYGICIVKTVINENWDQMARKDGDDLYAGPYGYGTECFCGCGVSGKCQLYELLRQDWTAIEPSEGFLKATAFVGGFVLKCADCGSHEIDSRCLDAIVRARHRRNCARNTLRTRVEMHCTECDQTSFDLLAEQDFKVLGPAPLNVMCACGCGKSTTDIDSSVGCQCADDDD